MSQYTTAQAILNIQNGMNIKYNLKQAKLDKFNILYLNINSLRNKLDELEINIHNIQKSNGKIIHFVALTETRVFEADTPFFNLNGYASFHCTRNDGYGGCALFVHGSLTGCMVNNISVHNIETLSINIVELSLIVSIVYKQPSVSDSILIDKVIDIMERRGKQIILGDFNINLLTNSNPVNKYIESIVANGFTVINKLEEKHATRIAQRRLNERIITTKTIIDHVITNCFSYAFIHSLDDVPFSDHKQMNISFDDRKNTQFLCIDKTIELTKLNERNYRNDVHNHLTTTFPDTLNDLLTQMDEIKKRNTNNNTITIKSNPQRDGLPINFCI